MVCHHQEKEDRPTCIKCSRESPCHTLKHCINSKVLTFSNLETVLDGWGIFYFKTAKEAEEAGNKRVEENIKKLRELGYAIDEQGFSHWVPDVGMANEYDNEFKKEV